MTPPSNPFFHRHHNACLASGARIVTDPSATADISQEAFLSVWLQAKRFDPALGTVRTWLVTIIHTRPPTTYAAHGATGGIPFPLIVMLMFTGRDWEDGNGDSAEIHPGVSG
ncbi:sigma factor [Fodinicola feengrottensis]|uniref:sigma factor n=1 Tax=Fodinicola feengrottensis TaxID=435914 RepID=UPI003CD0A427